MINKINKLKVENFIVAPNELLEIYSLPKAWEINLIIGTTLK